MSLNKWLCKHFDEENKGYVEVSDILFKILSKTITEINIMLFIVSVLIPIFIGFFYYISKIELSDSGADNTANLFTTVGTDNILIFIFNLWLIGIIAYVILYVIFKTISIIMKFKVAKCSLKNQEK